jgi:hypothetical protein
MDGCQAVAAISSLADLATYSESRVQASPQLSIVFPDSPHRA